MAEASSYPDIYINNFYNSCCYRWLFNSKMMENVTEMSDRSAGYHVIAKRWKSDLEFYKIESSFLRRLKQDYYFTRLQDYPNKAKLQKAGDDLLKLQLDIIRAETQVDAQLHQLTEVAENNIAENAKNLAMTNATVGDLMTALTHEYQEVKKEIFTALETVFSELEFKLG